jgi:glycosyltransferase involved in cell wall biosynthesis
MRFIFTERKASTIWGVLNPIASSLVARHDEVVFCRMDDENQRQPRDVPAGVRVDDIQVPPKRRFIDLYKQHRTFCKKFSDILEDFRPDVVHTNFCIPSISARLVAHRRSVPLIVSTQHELYDSMRLHYRWALRLTERYVQGIAYVSKGVARSFGRRAELFGRDFVDRSSCIHTVIYNGIDVEHIQRLCAGVGARELHKLVCSGRMVPVKGQAVLIRAMPGILRRFADARLVFIGSGPEEARLKQQVVDLGLSSHVEFLGWCPHDEVIREMASAGVVVVPSDGSQEGFGLVVAEAMACGTPIVASRIDVFEEVLGDGDNCGWFFEKRDAGALAEAVCQVLRHPEAHRRAMNAKERVKTRFSLDRMVGGYLAFYDSLERLLRSKWDDRTHGFHPIASADRNDTKADRGDGSMAQRRSAERAYLLRPRTEALCTRH